MSKRKREGGALLIESGCRARTNEKYAREISATPREMTVLRPHRPIGGCWITVWDGVVPVQYVHQNFLERVRS
jgi:hypothetical protein